MAALCRRSNWVTPSEIRLSFLPQHTPKLLLVLVSTARVLLPEHSTLATHLLSLVSELIRLGFPTFSQASQHVRSTEETDRTNHDFGGRFSRQFSSESCCECIRSKRIHYFRCKRPRKLQFSVLWAPVTMRVSDRAISHIHVCSSSQCTYRVLTDLGMLASYANTSTIERGLPTLQLLFRKYCQL